MNNIELIDKRIKELKEQIRMWEVFNNGGMLEEQIKEGNQELEALLKLKEYEENEVINDSFNNAKNELEKENNKQELPKVLEKKKENPPFSFDTTQTNVVVPTKDLIKHKDCDFRILLALSGISNCDDVYSEGDNSRYVSLKKLDSRAIELCETLGMSVSNFNKKIRTMLKKKSKEFHVVEKQGLNNTTVKCYQMDYESGGFILIPVKKAERCILTLGNNPIKLYCNLLWLCQLTDVEGNPRPTHVPQKTLAKLMGLSSSSEKIVKASTQSLINQNLIKVTKVREISTKINEEGFPVSNVTDRLYYEIIMDEEDEM